MTRIFSIGLIIVASVLFILNGIQFAIAGNNGDTNGLIQNGILMLLMVTIVDRELDRDY